MSLQSTSIRTRALKAIPPMKLFRNILLGFMGAIVLTAIFVASCDTDPPVKIPFYQITNRVPYGSFYIEGKGNCIGYTMLIFTAHVDRVYVVGWKPAEGWKETIVGRVEQSSFVFFMNPILAGHDEGIYTVTEMQ